MAAEFAVVSWDCPAGTGNTAHDFSLGWTPKAAIFFATQVTADDTSTPHSCIAWGCSDGTNEFSQGMDAEDAQGTTDTDEYASRDAFRLRQQGDKVDFTVTSWDSGGFTLNYGTVTSGTKLNAIVFGGDQNLLCGFQQTSDGTQDYQQTTAGFTPKFVFIFGQRGISDDTVYGDAQTNAGFSDGTNNRGWGLRIRDNQGTSNNICVLRNDYAVMEQTSTGADYVYAAKADTFASGSFYLRTDDTTPGGNEIFWLATDLDDEDVWVGSFDGPTSAASDWTVSTPNFEGRVVGQIWTSHDTENSKETSGDHFSGGFCAFDGTTIRSATVASADAQGTSIEDSWQSAGLYLERRNGASDTTGFDIDAISITSTGWEATAANIQNIDSAWQSAARKCAGFVLGTAVQVNPDLNLVSSADSVYNLTLGIAAQTFTLNLISSAESVYSLTLGIETNTIEPSLVSSAESAYNPTVGIADLAITLTLSSSAEVVYPHSLYQDNVDIGLVSSAETIYQALLFVGEQNLFLINSDETVFPLTLVRPVDMRGSGYGYWGDPGFTTPVSSPVALTVRSADTIYGPVVQPEDTFLLSTVAASESVYSVSQTKAAIEITLNYLVSYGVHPLMTAVALDPQVDTLLVASGESVPSLTLGIEAVVLDLSDAVAVISNENIPSADLIPVDNTFFLTTVASSEVLAPIDDIPRGAVSATLSLVAAVDTIYIPENFYEPPDLEVVFALVESLDTFPGVTLWGETRYVPLTNTSELIYQPTLEGVWIDGAGPTDVWTDDVDSGGVWADAS